MEAPTVSAAPSGGFGEQPSDWIGPYKLLEIIGEGGFGTVWLAERREPMVQRVALKIIKPGMDSKAVIARFEQERQALAVMDHPNVAKVFDGGVTPTGRPYFVMEHVQGEAITDFCDRHRLNIPQRLSLFILVCEAVHHAHIKGIIHRDLKPSNILVSLNGPHPAPKVIDFGVAKAISHTLTENTIVTMHGQMIGTPEYMSPEQAEMGAADIDTRTDVYSLGVVLYELLTGMLPFDPSDLRRRGVDEIRRIIRDVDPPTPSKRLSTAAASSADEIARKRRCARSAMTRELRRELEWILAKAMNKDRNERYSTPVALAEDVERYLAGAPIVPSGLPLRRVALRALWRERWFVVVMALEALLLLGMGWALQLHSIAMIESYEYQVSALRADSVLQALEEEHSSHAEDALVLLDDGAFIERSGTLAQYWHLPRLDSMQPLDEFENRAAQSFAGETSRLAFQDVRYRDWFAEVRFARVVRTSASSPASGMLVISRRSIDGARQRLLTTANLAATVGCTLLLAFMLGLLLRRALASRRTRA